MTKNDARISVPRWQRAELTFESAVSYDNPLQDVSLNVALTSPSGIVRMIDGFWDGDTTWRVRFAPDESGEWTYTTGCSDVHNTGLHNNNGTIICGEPSGSTRFEQHGPLRLSDDRRYLAHDDGTPFFWMGDTAWSGPLLSTKEEWHFYLKERVREKFSAVQFVGTQYRAAPDGNLEKQKAYTGFEPIAINPKFFQWMDARVDAINAADLLAVPVLLWAWGPPDRLDNPGASLPVDQAILLAKYMVARWGANDVVWILGGDGDYRGEKAARWRTIGRGVFGDSHHAPVALHPGGMHWIYNEFYDESWLDIMGYQSGHGDDDRTLSWIFNGPPSKDWQKEPPRPYINLEPPYENHIAYQSKQRHTPLSVRRACYWSLLSVPTAGVTYGGHGVWGWDNGVTPPVDHPYTGIPLPWQQALTMPAAEQMGYLVDFFTSIDWWRLCPAQELLASQPGETAPHRHIAAAKSDSGDEAFIYIPKDRSVDLHLESLKPNLKATWGNPRTGERSDASSTEANRSTRFETPGDGDWVLILKAG